MELPNGRSVILDVAHNADGAATLTRFLEDNLGEFDLLFGALADKEVSTFLPGLARGANRVILTSPASGRAMPVEQLAPLVADRSVIVEPDPETALCRGLEEGPGPLIVCGSVYLVGEIRTLLRNRFGTPPAAAKVSCWSRRPLESPTKVGSPGQLAGP